MAHVVAAKGEHGHGPRDLADRARGRGGGLGTQGGANEDAVNPVEGLIDQRHGRRAAAAEDQRANRDAVGIVGLGREGGVVGHGRGETAVGVGGGRLDCGVQGCPFQSVRPGGGSWVLPSHQTSRSGAFLPVMPVKQKIPLFLPVLLPLLPIIPLILLLQPLLQAVIPLQALLQALRILPMLLQPI